MESESERMIRLSEIKREDMPQVRSDDLPDAIRILQKSGIGVSVEKIPTNTIRPTQSNYNPDKVDRIVGAIEKGESMSPIVMSNDGHVIDGHHRLIAVKTISDNSKMNAIVINLPQKDALEAYRKVSNEEE